MRILHVVGSMGRGGAETWLMHVLRHIDRRRFAMDFLVYQAQKHAYEQEAESLGARLIRCPGPAHWWRHDRGFLNILRQCGPYDVVHSHVRHLSGAILRLAGQAGVRTRIAHIHNDMTHRRRTASPWRRYYFSRMTKWIEKHATHGFACSRASAISVFGPRWEDDPRWGVLHYGVQLSPFRRRGRAGELRAELRLPAEAFVIGHVGRFHPQKNHTFLLKVFDEVLKREPAAHLVLVGEGPLRNDVERQASDLGLSDAVHFLGLRPDVPRLLLEVMDVFLLPSLYEGLPLVLMESQAAALPAIVSDEVTEEAVAIRPLVKPLSLSRPPADWAQCVLEAGRTHPLISPDQALHEMEGSSFNIDFSVRALEEFYSRSMHDSNFAWGAPSGSWPVARLHRSS